MVSDKKNTILVVEDDKYILASLTEILEIEGYKVVTAGNGQDGLKYLRASADLPSVILLDLSMPIMDGYEFRKEQELDSRLCEIPVVLMSADRQIETRKIQIGISKHIPKPIDLDMLLETIKSFTSIKAN